MNGEGHRLDDRRGADQLRLLSQRESTAPRSHGHEVVVVDRDELRSLIVSAVREAVEPGNDGPEWMTVDQVAQILPYKRSYIPELCRRRGLPCHRIGRKLMFRRDEVQAWWDAKQGKR